MTVKAATQQSADTQQGATPGDDGAVELCGLMESLLAHLTEETELIRVGKLSEAAALASEKQVIADAYIALSSRLKPEAHRIAMTTPAEAARLRLLQDELHDALAFNLAVIATARDVTENLVRTVAHNIGAQAKPTVYSGRGARPSAAPLARGITLDRAL